MLVRDQCVKPQIRGEAKEETVLNTSSRPQNCYQIEDRHQSECSWVLFVRHAVTKQVGVLKILKPYHDTRYALHSVKARQECMFEALRINRVFSPSIYRGLMRVNQLDLHRGQVITGELIEKPGPKIIDHTSEYALVMHQLREEKRLDYLLSDARNDPFLLRHYKQLLLNRIVQMHCNLVQEADPTEQEPAWGSFDQLRAKLDGNFKLLERAFAKSKNGLCKDYGSWFEEQKRVLPELLEQSYANSFAHRVGDRHIKHCHGDLKAPNIWIVPRTNAYSGEVVDQVWFLDAIDFNASYSNIDTLSDLAMLLVDIEVRIGNYELASEMMKEYLRLTDQQYSEARVVLDYYLLEKAMVGAAVSVIDENSSSFSRAFLDVAVMHAKEFAREVGDLVPAMV